MAKDRVRGTRVTSLNFVQSLMVREARMRLVIDNTNGVEHRRQIGRASCRERV